MTDYAEPLYFGSVERPLFGWLHRPEPAIVPATGLLICSPLGYEAVCAHRTLKHFAGAAVSSGIPALRFDYDGTGDSAGTELDPHRVDAWINSIHSAIDALKAHTGVDRVSLLGIRLGATLAATVASQRSDITGFAAIAPVVNARTYLRELRALALARPQPAAPAGVAIDEDLQESAGFTLTAETRSQLTVIDLMKMERAPAHALIIDRDDLPGNEAWVTKLQSLGASVQHQRLPGYIEMMLDSHETVVPERIVAAIRQWLGGINPEQSRESLPAESPPCLDRAIFHGNRPDAVAIEQAVFIGSQEKIFGVLTTPPGRDLASQPAVAVLLLNSGAVHHIGPNRLYVTLARRWASRGTTVLRLDLSGLGDSPARAGELENIVYSRRAREDVDAAIEFLKTQCGATEVHAMGLCSGAYHSFKSAVAGAPLRTVVSINPLTFNWREGSSLAFPEHRVAADVMRYKTNAFQWDSWKKLLTGGVNIVELAQVLLRRLVSTTSSSLKDLVRRLHIPLPNDLGTELAALGRRNVDLLFVFANGEPGVDLLKNGGGSVVERLRAHKKLDIRMIDGADHTFTSRWTRDQLADLLSAHVEHWTGCR